jgi:hypothetical protein
VANFAACRSVSRKRSDQQSCHRKNGQITFHGTFSFLILLLCRPFGAIELTGATESGLFLEMSKTNMCGISVSSIAEIAKDLFSCTEEAA